MAARERKPDRRPGDRHVPENFRGVSVRLGTADFDRLETVRKARGFSRRAAVITAIRDWVARHETPEEHQS